MNFEISQDDKISLIGKNDCGKTSVIKAILGQVSYNGIIDYNRQLKISHVSQDTSSVTGTIDDWQKYRLKL